MRKCSGVVALKKGKVCIVRGTDGGWVLPKGGLVKNLTCEQNALKEAYEEAGVIGTIRSGPFDVKTKHARIQFFVVDVALAAKEWPEKWRRSRQFVSIDKARKKLGPAYSELLDMAV